MSQDNVEKFSDSAIDKGGNLADQKSGGKFGGQVDKTQDMADDRIGSADEEQPKQ